MGSINEEDDEVHSDRPAIPIVEKHVKIHENIEIHEASDTNSESEHMNSSSQRDNRHRRKDGTKERKEIIGILKPSNSGKEMLNSFPSLPDSFLQELGLLEHLSFSAENLTEKDIEKKYSALSLAFKMDRVTLADRLELQLRQRDISEKNVLDEIRQLKTTVKCLNRFCQNSEIRDVLERIIKQISILHQSIHRVSSASEQFGAVQQEMRFSTTVEIMMLHLENIKRSYAREHSELEETKRVLVKNKLLESENTREGGFPRLRSISVIQGSSSMETADHRRASVASTKNLSVEQTGMFGRPKSPTLLHLVTRTPASCFSEDMFKKGETKPHSFSTVEEDDHKYDTNNNNSSSSGGLRKLSLLEQRRESRRQSQFEVETILEEMDELAQQRDSTPPPLNLLAPGPGVLHSRPVLSIHNRKKSLLLHLQTWYAELYWPYDEEETLLGLRYCLSGVLSVTALVVVLATLFG